MLLASGAAALLLAACTTGSTGSSSHDTSAGQQSTANTPTTGLSSTDLTSAAPTDVVSTSGAGTSSPPSGSGAPQSEAAKTVPVHITIGSWNAQSGEAQVDAFVPGHVIQGGTCTLTMTQGGTSRTAQHPAVTTPTATSCGLISIPRSELAAGTWSAVVRFAAPTASGQSDPTNIEVPA
jgi:hypothetical protein